MKSIVADVGNSSTKCAMVDPATDNLARPQWEDRFEFRDAEQLHRLDDAPLRWTICSVNRKRLDAIVVAIEEFRPADFIGVINHQQIPLRVEVDEPAKVGVDRLCAATAAFALREPDHGCVVVDIGTATTIDGVSSDGEFLGGTIFPGIQSSLRQLARSTDALPLLDPRECRVSENGLGKSTDRAIATGVVLAQLGAVKEISGRIGQELNGPHAVVLTGGGLNSIRDYLPPNWIEVQDLVLRGAAQIGARWAEA